MRARTGLILQHSGQIAYVSNCGTPADIGEFSAARNKPSAKITTLREAAM